MSPRLLMIVSSIVLACAGLALTFAPQEFVAAVSGAENVALTLLAQVLGACYLGFAAMNWMARANLIGGIYSRPVALGNLMHFFVAAIALVKSAFGETGDLALLAITIVYCLLAAGFGWVTFGYSVPVQKKPGPG